MANEAKHSQGPWHGVELMDDDERVIKVCAPNGCTVAVFRRCGAEDLQNARLIAAAPELLAALQAEEEWQARDLAGAIDPEWDYETMVGAKRRAVIAKATGVAQ